MKDWKITPGPWKVSRTGSKSDAFEIYKDNGPDYDSEMLCKLYNYNREDDEDQPFVNAEANARAISALPDLIEAAEKALSAFDDQDFGTTRMETGQWYTIAYDAENALRTALAKAKGEKL
jgi:hypothetical protein